MIEKDININDVVKYLKRAFAKAAYNASGSLGKSAIRWKNFENEWESTRLYDYQVDFAYLINKVQRAPTYDSRKAIQATNELIQKLEGEE